MTVLLLGAVSGFIARPHLIRFWNFLGGVEEIA